MLHNLTTCCQVVNMLTTDHVSVNARIAPVLRSAAPTPNTLVQWGAVLGSGATFVAWVVPEFDHAGANAPGTVHAHW